MNVAYLELKLSWELHQCAPENLAMPERERLSQTARRQEALESLILRSPEALGVVVSPAQVAERVGQIRGRYGDESEMAEDLARLGMDRAALEAAIGRDLAVEAVIERVACSVPEVSATDAEIFYHLHRPRFMRPETRELRHILITTNSRSELRAARDTLKSAAATLTDVESFGRAALRLSHCPSALEGGRLGRVARGQLFAALEQAAFRLAPGALSDIVRSEMGLHLVWCESVQTGGEVPFDEARAEIVRHLTAIRRQSRRKSWLIDLARRLKTTSVESGR